MWNVKTNAVPVMIVATGTISESFRKYLSNILGKYESKELQKTAVLGTANSTKDMTMETALYAP
jgi:hypothetical protein